MRAGIGWDIHRLELGRPFVLGGIRLPSDRGPVGHSDGDALTHAVVDAVLGAAGLGDIGEHFPDTDPQWKGVASIDTFLRDACTMARRAGFTIQSVDATVMLEGLKLKDYKVQIRDSLARKMGVDAALVNVKAKTFEGIGEIGRYEAVAAQAIVLISALGAPPPKPVLKGFRR